MLFRSYYCLNDKIEDVIHSDEGMKFFHRILEDVGMFREASFAEPENMEKLIRMMGGFTVIRMLNTLGSVGDTMTKEQLLSLNEQLNQIPRKSS